RFVRGLPFACGIRCAAETCRDNQKIISTTSLLSPPVNPSGALSHSLPYLSTGVLPHLYPSNVGLTVVADDGYHVHGRRSPVFLPFYFVLRQTSSEWVLSRPRGESVFLSFFLLRFFHFTSMDGLVHH
ncbi:unnamed protein product, partial [Ectocarpus sp. 12 AP-2014]